jgi:hypothetical protein
MEMDEAKMLKDIKSAGGWFVGEYAAMILENHEKLSIDKAYKLEFIKKIFHDCGRDKDLGGTRTRVNALIRIIKRDELIDALQYIMESDNINRSEPEVVKTAIRTLQKLK